MSLAKVFRSSVAAVAVLVMSASLIAAVPAQASQPDLALISELTGMEASHVSLGPDWVFDAEHQVYLREPAFQPSQSTPNPSARAESLARLSTDGLLLIPNSTAKMIMTFDPDTGDLIDPEFIVLDPDATGTAIHAIMSANNTILLSDQIRDVVHQYDLDGNYMGVFAPAGGVDTSILDNIRGISLRPNGNLLVTVASSANANAIAEFDTDGNYIGNFIDNGAGGLNSPFDVYRRVGTDWLVSSINSNQVLSFELETGNPIGEFSPISSFPQQILEIGAGNVLVANFSGTQGVYEFDADGNVIGIYNPTQIGGYRGVWELANGNILTTTGAGVFEINRDGQLVDTKYDGVGRFIEYVVDWSVSVGELPGDQNPNVVPTALAINAVAPNPFNPRTTIHFDLPRAGQVTVAIHDVRGRHVQTLAEGMLESGRHQVSWDGFNAQGSAMPSGVYLVRLFTADGARTTKMTLAR